MNPLSPEILIAAALLWSVPWKGVALWKAARNNQMGWFAVLMLINTLAVLEIIYIAFFQKDKNKN